MSARAEGSGCWGERRDQRSKEVRLRRQFRAESGLRLRLPPLLLLQPPTSSSSTPAAAAAAAVGHRHSSSTDAGGSSRRQIQRNRNSRNCCSRAKKAARTDCHTTAAQAFSLCLSLSLPFSPLVCLCADLWLLLPLVSGYRGTQARERERALLSLSFPPSLLSLSFPLTLPPSFCPTFASSLRSVSLS